MTKLSKILFIAVSIFILCLIGCRSQFDKSMEAEFKRLEQLQEPSANLTRTADTPLVAAIPGLNVPFAPVGAAQFGDLPDMLERDGIPSFIVAYDEKIHPLSAVSGLYSEEYSIAKTRVLPILTAAIAKENEIRRAQNVPDLKELVIVSYSQGSVLGLDVVRGFVAFRQEWSDFLRQVGNEWDRLKQDPEFVLLRDTIANFQLLDKIRIERQQEYQRSYYFQKFYQRMSEELAKTGTRFTTYLISPETNVRPYPAIARWFEQNKLADKEVSSFLCNFWARYIEYETLLPLQLRLFSLAGSFFGTGTANVGFGLLEILPNKGELLVGPIAGQVKDTQLGTQYHLEVIRDILAYSKKVGSQRAAQNIYFILGVNGDKGDGLVPEYSAHFSSHLYTSISMQDLLTDSVVLPRIFSSQRLPEYPLTGLKVHHLPRRELFFFEKPGVAQMSDKSKVYPYLQAFIRKETVNLERMHQSQHQPMRQFMVVVNLPVSGEMDQCGLELIADSPRIKITGRYYNRSSHAMVWTGLFKSKNPVLASENPMLKYSADVILKISKLIKPDIHIKLTVHPGIAHFVEISTPDVKNQASVHKIVRNTREIGGRN